MGCIILQAIRRLAGICSPCLHPMVTIPFTIGNSCYLEHFLSVHHVHRPYHHISDSISSATYFFKQISIIMWTGYRFVMRQSLRVPGFESWPVLLSKALYQTFFKTNNPSTSLDCGESVLEV